MSAIRYGNRSLKRNRRVVFPASPPLGLDGQNSHGKVPNVVTRSTAKFHPQGFLIPAGGDLGKGEFRC